MSAKIYETPAERQAARNARQNAKRALLMLAGYTTKGTPRKRHVRGAGIHSLSRQVKAPSVPSQSVEDFIACGGRVERLPGLRYSLPPQMPLGVCA